MNISVLSPKDRKMPLARENRQSLSHGMTAGDGVILLEKDKP
jgi:hypothetical protein